MQILPRADGPSFKERLAKGMAGSGSALGQGIAGYYQDQAEQQSLTDLYDEEKAKAYMGLDPSFRAKLIEQDMKQAGKAGERLQDLEDFSYKESYRDKLQEDRENRKLARQEEKEELKQVEDFEGLSGIVNKMREISDKNNIGRFSSAARAWGGETAADAAAYERLGKSLIQQISTMNIRNKEEFLTMAEGLYDPYKTKAERDAILDSIVEILEASHPKAAKKVRQGQGSESKEGPKKRRKLSEFYG